MEAGWEHVERGISRDHGTKEREREKDLPRYHDQGGEEGAREEAGGVEGGENEDQQGGNEEGVGE